MKKWEKLQWYVAHKLEDIGIDARPTKASGGSTELGDVINFRFIIECMPGTSRILTPLGYRNIDALTINDEVIDASGKITKIVKMFDREYVGNLYNIRGSYNFKSILLTEEHPLLVRKNYNTKEKWITPKKLFKTFVSRKTPYLAFPKLWRDTRLLKKKYLNKELNLKYDTAMMKIFGWYLSEGYISQEQRTKLKKKSVVFTLGKKELDYAIELKTLLIKQGFDNTKLYIQDKRNTIVVKCNHNDFAEILEKLFKTGAYEKTIPFYFKDLEDSLLYTFIKYLIRGDGHRDKYCVHYSSYSISLLHQLRNLLLCLNINSSISGTRGQETQLRVYGADNKLATICDKLPTKKLNFNRKKRKERCFILQNKLWHRIITVIKQPYKGTVYNLETKSGTYVCENIIVHNCKQRATKHLKIDMDVWAKNKADIPLRSHKLPLLFLENIEGKRFAVLEADDLFSILDVTSDFNVCT